MALLFLPSDSISSYNLIKTQYLELPNDEIAKVQRMGNYIKSNGLIRYLQKNFPYGIRKCLPIMELKITMGG